MLVWASRFASFTSFIRSRRAIRSSPAFGGASAAIPLAAWRTSWRKIRAGGDGYRR